MAKKIIISFTTNPISTDYLKYTLYQGINPIPYAGGVTDVILDFSELTIGSTLTETIDITIDYLRTNFIYNKITYQRVDNTIEVFINYPGITSTFIGNLDYEFLDVPNEVINLKYFIQYKNHVNDDYFLGIYGKNFEGTAKEVNGKVTIEKGKIEDHLDPIRGTGLGIELEASTLLKFEDLYSDNEQDYMVRLYKNSKVVFVGYLKPDGIFQSFTRNEWKINLTCVDGLGALENLSFVKDDGTFFGGKMKAIDIIYYCLKRTGINLNINTSVNIYYEGLTLTDELDILAKIKMVSDRFVKVDDSTIMSCSEVLKSVLDIFCACITQQDGEWYIFRPNELYSNQIVKFKRYDLDGIYSNLVTKNLSKSIGSQIDNFYPHHCGGNQRIEIKGGISAYRLGYKYGYVKGLVDNPTLIHDANFNYAGWTIPNTVPLVKDPNTTKGLNISNSFAEIDFNMNLDPIPVLTGDLLTWKLNWSVIKGNSQAIATAIYMVIKVGSHYLKYVPQNSSTPFQDALDKTIWTTNPNDKWIVWLWRDGSFEFPIPAIPENGNLEIKIKSIDNGLRPIFQPDGSVLFSKFDIAPTEAQKVEIGEFHTSSRADKISSLVKETSTVYNGDNQGIIYLGAIYKENGINTTDKWFRNKFYESKPILQIASEDQLRILQKPMQVFSGDLYGYIPYLSVFEINEIRGKFMFMEYSYDTLTNITTIKALELYSAEISDLIYNFTFDYGNTVKPTITG